MDNVTGTTPSSQDKGKGPQIQFGSLKLSLGRSEDDPPSFDEKDINEGGHSGDSGNDGGCGGV